MSWVGGGPLDERIQLLPELVAKLVVDTVVMAQIRETSPESRSSASLLLDTADKLLMRNRGHLTRVHLPLALLNLLIRHVRSRRRQCVKELCNKRGAIAIRKSHVLLAQYPQVS